MKGLLNLNLLILAVLVVANVNANTPVPGPTPPTPPVIKGNGASPTKPLTFYCPDKIGVAPSPLPAGWQSLGNVTRHRQSISVDTQKHMVVCWYGTAGDTNFFVSSLIGQTFPADYECKIPSPVIFAAVCNRKIRVVP